MDRSTAARRDLGYESEWTLERGLADYAEWLKTHEA
jgi:nucleoside-diphosphate-sugar epimerase